MTFSIVGPRCLFQLFRKKIMDPSRGDASIDLKALGLVRHKQKDHICPECQELAIFSMSPLIRLTVSLCACLSVAKKPAWPEVNLSGSLAISLWRLAFVWSHLLWSNGEELLLCCKCAPNISVWRHYWETNFWCSQRTPFSGWMTRASSKKPQLQRGYKETVDGKHVRKPTNHSLQFWQIRLRCACRGQRTGWKSYLACRRKG